MARSMAVRNVLKYKSKPILDKKVDLSQFDDTHYWTKPKNKKGR